MTKMSKTFTFVFICCASLNYAIQSAYVIDNVMNNKQNFRNPFATSEIVEGDILTIQNADNIYKKLVIKYQAEGDSKLWMNGVVPYELDSEVEQHKCLIEVAMAHIMLQSCVYFRPKQKSDSDYIRIFRGNGCFATIGRNSQGLVKELPNGINPPVLNQVSLGDGCHYFGTIVHELMHILGFQHEHKRHDRDNYLKVHYANIKHAKVNKHNFDTYKKSNERRFTEFDYDSIMMYGPTDFGKDGKVTIESLVSGKVLGQRKGLSALDVQSINALYKCESVQNFACTKFAQTVIHLRHCHCETHKYVDMNLLKPLYQSCKQVLKK